MKKIVLISLISFFQLQNANAQKLNYDIIKDEPKNFKPFSLSLEPFNGGMYMGNPLIGARIRADVILLKRIEARFDYNYFYLDGEAHNTKLSKSKSFEIGGSLYLLNREKSKKLDVTLYSSSGGGKTYREYIYIPGHKYVMIGVRGGVLVESTNFTAKTGVNLVGVNVQNPNDSLPTGVLGEFTTKLNSVIFYGGISRKGITDLVAEVDGYSKKKGKNQMHDLYVDVMLGTVMSIANVKTTTKEFEIIPTKSGVKQMIGWRVGWVYRGPSKVNFAVKFEFGSKPQIITGDKFGAYYGFVGFGLNIPMTIKALQNIGKKKSTTETPVNTTTPTTN